MRKNWICQTKWIIYVASIAVCLLGVSYAAYTDNLVVNSRINSAKMNYSFTFDGKNLNVTLDSSTANYMLSMGQGDRYEIDYSINNDDHNNIPLKSISNKYIGSIDIQLKNSEFQMQNYGYLLSLLPSSLGIFECYHDFDGTNGTISLIKVSQAQQLNTVINKKALPIEILQQLGLANNADDIDNDQSELVDEAINPMDEEDLTDISVEIAEDDIAEESNPEDIISEDNNSGDKQALEKKVIYKKKKVIVMSIGIEGTYEFKIPLVYDQFNNNLDD